MRGALVLLSCYFYVVSTIIDDSILFSIDYASISEAPSHASLMERLEANDESVMKVRSADDEDFICQLPEEPKEEQGTSEFYNGPSPSDLLQPLYKDKVCSYRPDTYWIYEICHGRYVLQFHEEKTKSGIVSRTEYYLGNFRQDYASLSSKIEDHMNPPKKLIGDEERAYFSVQYSQGTTCDITGKPRTTVVQYVCDPDARNQVYSFAEVSSCHYEAVILTSRLCSHPAYKPKTKKETKIWCYNLDEDAPPKPIAHIQKDNSQSQKFHSEYKIFKLDGSNMKELIDLVADQMRSEFQPYMEITGERAGPKSTDVMDSLANNRMIVENTVNMILTARECIYGGGQGWWKYEFCYGKSVIQYHEEKNGDRTEILLGEFDLSVHKAWVDEKKEDRGPKQVVDKIVQVSHLFSKGDICEETGAHRSVEVRIRCKKVQDAPLAVAMTLTEPNTCQYIMTIVSERFCEPMQFADEYGIVHLTESKREPHTEL